jgi:tetratricopeptide (TPR) repeat protein
MKLFGPDHNLAIMSKYSLAGLRGITGDYESKVAIYRELLQIFLLRFGTRSRDTLASLQALGFALESCNQYCEAESLLCIAVQLNFELSSRTDRDTMTVKTSFRAMNQLARALNSQGRFADGRSVLNCAAECFNDFIRIESPSCFLYFHEKARALRSEGCLFESEEILRALLRHAPNHGRHNTMLGMTELAYILMRTGREPEAGTLLEKVFSTDIEIRGIEHRFSKWGCQQLGFCYARQGRYDDAIFLFEQTIEKLTLSNLGDPDFRNEYIDELRDWIIEVEGVKEDALNLEQIGQDTAPDLI